jgi:hypothetical protein
MKSPIKLHAPAWAAALAASLLALSTAGCGGDEQVARTGSGGTGIATTVGTVTGFGSVIVDGDRWDDRGAVVEVEDDPRQPATVNTTGVRLGQRLGIESRTVGRADRIRIEPLLIGRVESLSLGLGSPTIIRIAGQEVRINFDPNRGPVTFFDSFAQLAALIPNGINGSMTEVHGTLVWDARAARHVIEASRIEKLAALPAGLMRVTGIVSARTADDFRLGDLLVRVPNSALVLPAKQAIANGQMVTAWGSALASTPSLTLTADAVRIRQLDAQPADASAQLSGTLSRLDAANATFELAGVPVSARNALIVPANQSLAEGQYVIVRGRIGTAGVLQADQVRIRRKQSGEPEVELVGPITDYASDASFRVRGTLVNAAGVTPRPRCPAVLANGVVVSIEGGVQSNVVQADKLSCP